MAVRLRKWPSVYENFAECWLAVDAFGLSICAFWLAVGVFRPSVYENGHPFTKIFVNESGRFAPLLLAKCHNIAVYTIQFTKFTKFTPFFNRLRIAKTKTLFF